MSKRSNRPTTAMEKAAILRAETDAIVEEVIKSIPHLKAAKAAALASRNNDSGIVEGLVQRFKQRAKS